MSKAKAWAVHYLWGLLILGDVLLNLLIAVFTPAYLVVAWKETMSARAGRMRDKPQRIWGWVANAIDALAYLIVGQKDHCKTQVEREAKFGGVWGAWRLEAPNAPPQPPTEGGVSP